MSRAPSLESAAAMLGRLGGLAGSVEDKRKAQLASAKARSRNARAREKEAKKNKAA